MTSAVLLIALFMYMAPADAARFDDDPSITVQMHNTQGQSVGTMEVIQLAQGTLFVADLKNLSPGSHALHIHQKAKCDPPDFKSAGDHYNPAGKKHGLDNMQGYHAGDLPNVHVSEQGSAEAEIFVRRFVLGMSSNAGQNGLVEAGSDEGSFLLLDENGSAIIIHEKGDDYEAEPPGSTGSRIACGVIQQQ